MKSAAAGGMLVAAQNQGTSEAVPRRHSRRRHEVHELEPGCRQRGRGARQGGESRDDVIALTVGPS